MNDKPMTPSGVFSAISELRKEVNDGFTNIYNRLDANLKRQTDHEKEDAGELSAHGNQISTNTAEIEKLREEIGGAKGPGKLGWASNAGAWLAAAIAGAYTYFSRKHS